MIGIATYYQTLVIPVIAGEDGCVGADIPVENVSEFIHTRALFNYIIIASKDYGYVGSLFTAFPLA